MNSQWSLRVLGVAFAFVTSFPLGYAKESAAESVAIDPLYRDLETGMSTQESVAKPGMALTVDLGSARLSIPPHFAKQEILEIKRTLYLGPGLEDAVLVGLHGYAEKDAPSEARTIIYNLKDGKAELKAELPMREYFIGFEVLQIDGEPVLAIHGASGAHFHDLWLYRFKTGKPELLLAQGSAAGVELRADGESSNPQVFVGVESWAEPGWNYATGKRRWNVYTWNGQSFTLDAKLSTAPLAVAEERTQSYVAAVMQKLHQGNTQ